MSFEIQRQIKNNALQIKQYVNDLYDWEEHVAIKEKAKKKLQQQMKISENNKELEKIQKKKQIQKVQKVVENKIKPKQLIRDKNTVADYYKAWDSYNIDEELKKLQEQQQKMYKPYNPYEDSKNNIRAKPKAAMNIKGGRKVIKDPTSLKDKGNLHYKVCQYDKAINCYTECIEKLLNSEQTQDNTKLLALVLSNRAMTYVKINQRTKALEDCNLSIQYDPKYTKSYLRRAQCFKKISKYRQALADYQTIKAITPQDNDINIEIDKLKNILEKRAKEAAKNMIVKDFPETIVGSYRIQIEEYEDFEDFQFRADEKTNNYLQEL